VGVVADVTNQGLQTPVEPEVWVPTTVTGSGAQVLLVRSQQTPTALMNDVRQAVWATDAVWHGLPERAGESHHQLLMRALVLRSC